MEIIRESLFETVGVYPDERFEGEAEFKKTFGERVQPSPEYREFLEKQVFMEMKLKDTKNEYFTLLTYCHSASYQRYYFGMEEEGEVFPVAQHGNYAFLVYAKGEMGWGVYIADLSADMEDGLLYMARELEDVLRSRKLIRRWMNYGFLYWQDGEKLQGNLNLAEVSCIKGKTNNIPCHIESTYDTLFSKVNGVALVYAKEKSLYIYNNSEIEEKKPLVQSNETPIGVTEKGILLYYKAGEGYYSSNGKKRVTYLGKDLAFILNDETSLNRLF